jgi:hypothetical protein
MTVLFFDFWFFIVRKLLLPESVSTMHKRLLNSLRNTVGLALLILLSVTAQATDSNPHIVNKQTPQSGCTDCHIKTPELKNNNNLNTNGLPVDISQFKPESEALCMTCHPRDHVHKNEAGKIIFSLPPDIPVGQSHEHICQTCHYSHGKLDSDKPQANVNFIDKLFDTERMHKSFLLRRDNSDGGLCLTCHNPDNSIRP